MLTIGTMPHALPSIAIAEDPAAGLRDGWKWRTTIPPLKFEDVVVTRECRVMMWVENGWLLVRRSTVDDDMEWQVVLARASDPVKPQIKLNEATGGMELRYREYFIREGVAGRLRIYRERKANDSPEWPALALEGERRSLGSGSCPTAAIGSFALEQWCWIECGRTAKHPDLWVRLQPTTNHDGAASRGNAIFGFYGTADGPAEMFYGDSQVQDEGDLFIGTRKNSDEAERGLDDFQLDRAFRAKGAPALVASEWLKNVDALSLDKLDGQVVLLYFWADWCKGSVNKLPRVEQLHKKFGDRGLVVIGIHSAENSDSASRSVKDNTVSFPVMIDSGETAKGYRVAALPSCFLIDKTGKVVWGYGMAPPAEAQIEKLLK
jgi:thiol-disulfide isomerase/thioredoxin